MPRVHVSDYSNSILLAEAALPSTGGTIIIGDTPIAGADLTKDGLTILGEGKPRYNSSYTALENGSIIRGRLSCNKGNFTVENLGIDNGSTQMALNPTANPDCLFVSKNTNLTYDPLYDVHFRDVITLCSVTGHNILIQAVERVTVDNIETRLGFWGTVLKAVGVVATNLKNNKNSWGSLVIKSESYAPVADIAVSNCISDNIGVTNPSGADICNILVYASGAGLGSVTINNANGAGGTIGFFSICEGRSNSSSIWNRNVLLNNAVFRLQSGVSVKATGAQYNLSLCNVSVQNMSSGKALSIDAENMFTNISNFFANVPTSTNLDDAFYLAGRYNISNIAVTRGGDVTSLAGIQLRPDTTGTSPNIVTLGNASQLFGRLT